MNGTFSIAASLAAGIMGFSLVYTADDIVNPPSQKALVLELLRYNNDGTVTQRLSGDIAADWSARISREVDGITSVLCEGQGKGKGLYVGDEATFTTDVWTGGDCPTLQNGDILTASWEYRNEYGYFVTTFGEVVVGADQHGTASAVE